METRQITVDEYCSYYKVAPEFIVALEDAGIITLANRGVEKFIDDDLLQELERYRIWHFEFQINFEGIDVIRHLLERQIALQNELNQLREALKLYQ